jgi:hypothetical protein
LAAPRVYPALVNASAPHPHVHNNRQAGSEQAAGEEEGAPTTRIDRGRMDAKAKSEKRVVYVGTCMCAPAITSCIVWTADRLHRHATRSRAKEQMQQPASIPMHKIDSFHAYDPDTHTKHHAAGGLAEDCTEEMLHAAFIPFGDIVEVTIPKDFKESACRRRLMVCLLIRWGRGRSALPRFGSAGMLAWVHMIGKAAKQSPTPNQRRRPPLPFVFLPPHTDTTRGFGFVHYESAEDAAAAIDNMEGAWCKVSSQYCTQ